MSYQQATMQVLQNTLNQKPGQRDNLDESNHSGSIQVGDHFFASQHVQDFTDMIECSHALRVVGLPGGGKTFFMEHCAPHLMADLIGSEVKLAWTQPMQLRSVNDLYVRPSFRSGDLVWDLGPVITAVQEAIETQTPVLVVVDEANRIEPKDQGILLPLADNQQRLWVEQIGRYFDFPAFSRVVLTGNIKGKGVYPWVEALRSRTPEIRFEMPDEDALVKQIASEADAISLPRHTESRYGIRRRHHRPLDDSGIRMLCQAAMIANRYANDSEGVSIRELLVCARLYSQCEPARALDKIGRLLTQHLNEAEDAGRRAGLQIQGLLKQKLQTR